MRFHVVFFCVVLSANLTSFLRAQYITLKIPHNDLADEKFSTFSTKRYYFVTYFKANFFRAHQYCQLNGMELMTVDSKDEETAFLNLINNKDFEFRTSKDFWTSGTDLGQEGNFFFLSNGKVIGEMSWSKDEPNNARKADNNETENCMGYVMTDNLKFYRLFDRYCSVKSNFICQVIPSKKPFKDFKI